MPWLNNRRAKSVPKDTGLTPACLRGVWASPPRLLDASPNRAAQQSGSNSSKTCSLFAAQTYRARQCRGRIRHLPVSPRRSRSKPRQLLLRPSMPQPCPGTTRHVEAMQNRTFLPCEEAAAGSKQPFRSERASAVSSSPILWVQMRRRSRAFRRLCCTKSLVSPTAQLRVYSACDFKPPVGVSSRRNCAEQRGVALGHAFTWGLPALGGDSTLGLENLPTKQSSSAVLPKCRISRQCPLTNSALCRTHSEKETETARSAETPAPTLPDLRVRPSQRAYPPLNLSSAALFSGSRSVSSCIRSRKLGEY